MFLLLYVQLNYLDGLCSDGRLFYHGTSLMGLGLVGSCAWGSEVGASRGVNLLEEEEGVWSAMALV